MTYHNHNRTRIPAMPQKKTDPKKLAALLATLAEVAGAALDGGTSVTAEDALDVIEVIESRCRAAVYEFHGMKAEEDLAWEMVVTPAGVAPF